MFGTILPWANYNKRRYKQNYGYENKEENILKGKKMQVDAITLERR